MSTAHLLTVHASVKKFQHVSGGGGVLYSELQVEQDWNEFFWGGGVGLHKRGPRTRAGISLDDWQIKHEWKHNLPATSLAGG